MSYNDSDTSYDDSDAGYTEFNVWEVASDTQSASEAIAERVAVMQKAFGEIMALADAFDVYVNFSLDSEFCRGHNQGAHIYWNPSSQHC